MKQDISNNEENRIQYFHNVQRVAKILKKVYLNECKQLKKDILNLNLKKKEVIMFERSKLY